MCSLRRKALNKVRRLVKAKPVKFALYSILLMGCQKHTVISRNYQDPSQADKFTPPSSPSVIKTIAPAAPGNYNASLMNFLAYLPERYVTSATEDLVQIFENYDLPNKSFENYANTTLLAKDKQQDFVNFITEHSLLIFEDYFTELLAQKLELSTVHCRLSYEPIESKKMKSAISEEYFLEDYASTPTWEALPHMIPNFKSGDYEISKIEDNQFIFKWSAICNSRSNVVAQMLTGYFLVNMNTYSLEPRFEHSRPYFIQSIDKISSSPLDKLHINSTVNKDFRVQEITPNFKSFFLSYSR